MVERELALRQARKLMALHGITEAELEEQEPDGASPQKPLRVVVPDDSFLKYYDIATRQGWNGMGAQPQWLRDVLLGQGRSTSELSKAARAKMLDLYLNHKLRNAHEVQ